MTDRPTARERPVRRGPPPQDRPRDRVDAVERRDVPGPISPPARPRLDCGSSPGSPASKWRRSPQSSRRGGLDGRRGDPGRPPGAVLGRHARPLRGRTGRCGGLVSYRRVRRYSRGRAEGGGRPDERRHAGPARRAGQRIVRWPSRRRARAGREPRAGLAGVAGQPVHAVPAGGLSAAVSTVSLAEFGQEPLRPHLEDLTWLEQTARAHHRVVEAVADGPPVIPMRLATLYHDDGKVAAMLAERHDDFTAALDPVTGQTEWGVKRTHPRPPRAGQTRCPLSQAPDRAPAT